MFCLFVIFGLFLIPPIKEQEGLSTVRIGMSRTFADQLVNVNTGDAILCA